MQTTKANRIAQQEASHINWLIALGMDRDMAQTKGLHHLRVSEGRMHRAAERYCNGEIDETILTRTEDRVTEKLIVLFNGKLPDGFFINTDPRGYALKIEDSVMKENQEEWAKLGLSPERDWGGYGILAPEFK